MKKSELTSFEIQEDNFKLSISRDKGIEVSNAPAYPPANVIAPVAAAPVAAPAAAPAAAPVVEDNATYIKSPMVGTFYRAPSPDSAPFVKENDTVQDDSVVCIIEAMKVMNEIQADLSGKVVEFLVKDGDAVEFGQNLIKVK